MSQCVAKMDKQSPTRHTQKTFFAAIIVCALGLAGCGAPSNQSTTPANAGTGSGVQLSYQPSQFSANDSLESKWLKIDDANQAVTLSLRLMPSNLSLNGFHNGFAAMTVPLGWHVTVNFRNDNPNISGGIMVSNPKATSTGPIVPALPGATMKNPTKGIPVGKTASFSFQATKAGAYVIESVPTAGSGSWMWFVVTPHGTKPTIETKG